MYSLDTELVCIPRSVGAVMTEEDLNYSGVHMGSDYSRKMARIRNKKGKLLSLISLANVVCSIHM